MKHLTVKDLLDFILDNNVPMDAEIIMEDGSCGVHVIKLISEKVGTIDCLSFCNDMVSIKT